MLDIKQVFKRGEAAKEGEGIELRSPKHIAVNIRGVRLWAEENKKTIEEADKKKCGVLKDMIRLQPKYNITILSFYLLPKSMITEEYFSRSIDSVVGFFKDLLEDDFLQESRTKVSILGKWYNLPGRLVEVIKEITDKTKDYDKHFLNFCINYDGQEEIVDACRIISMIVRSGKMDPDSIEKSTIKENIYTSGMVPPDLFIKTGKKRILSDFMMWESPNAKIYFADKLWNDFTESDFKKAVDFWRK